MHTIASTQHWHNANDNEKEVPFEPPSMTPVAAKTILIACTDNDVAMPKDAAPAHPTGFTEMGVSAGAPNIMLNFSTFCLFREAVPSIRIAANDF